MCAQNWPNRIVTARGAIRNGNPIMPAIAVQAKKATLKSALSPRSSSDLGFGRAKVRHRTQALDNGTEQRAQIFAVFACQH